MADAPERTLAKRIKALLMVEGVTADHPRTEPWNKLLAEVAALEVDREAIRKWIAAGVYDGHRACLLLPARGVEKEAVDRALAKGEKREWWEGGVPCPDCGKYLVTPKVPCKACGALAKGKNDG